MLYLKTQLTLEMCVSVSPRKHSRRFLPGLPNTALQVLGTAVRERHKNTRAKNNPLMAMIIYLNVPRKASPKLL